ncbi:MAG: DUF4936 family protein [Caldimonas sp.]
MRRSPGPRELFVWYRVEAARLRPAHAAVLEMQDRLRAEVSGLQARLLTRSEDGSTVQTWMETYARPDDVQGVCTATQALIEDRARSLAAMTEGARHAEAFLPA